MMIRYCTAVRRSAALAAAAAAGLDREELLQMAGFRIEGPGVELGGDSEPVFWFTLIRPTWSGVVFGQAAADREEVVEEAVSTLVNDDDIDWEAGGIAEKAQSDFGAQFASVVRRAGSILRQDVPLLHQVGA